MVGYQRRTGKIAAGKNMLFPAQFADSLVRSHKALLANPPMRYRILGRISAHDGAGTAGIFQSLRPTASGFRGAANSAHWSGKWPALLLGLSVQPNRCEHFIG